MARYYRLIFPEAWFKVNSSSLLLKDKRCTRTNYIVHSCPLNDTHTHTQAHRVVMVLGALGTVVGLGLILGHTGGKFTVVRSPS